jgi:hypothetical protein
MFSMAPEKKGAFTPPAKYSSHPLESTTSMFIGRIPATRSNELDNLFSLQVQVDPPHIERGFRNLFGLDDKHLPISPFYMYSSFPFRSF